MSVSTPNLFSCKLIAVVIAGREVLMVRKRPRPVGSARWRSPGREHPEAGIRRIVESDSSTVVAITGLVGIYNRSTPRLSLVFPGPARRRPDPPWSGLDWLSLGTGDNCTCLVPPTAAEQTRHALTAATDVISGHLPGAAVARLRVAR